MLEKIEVLELRGGRFLTSFKDLSFATLVQEMPPEITEEILIRYPTIENLESLLTECVYMAFRDTDGGSFAPMIVRGSLSGMVKRVNKAIEQARSPQWPTGMTVSHKWENQNEVRLDEVN